MNRYTEEEKEFLKKISYGKSRKEITDLFNKKFNRNCTNNQINSLRKRIGALTGKTGYFKKKNVPWNKDKKGYMGPNKTSFKKGHKPKNWKPIGSERINVDGYYEVKVSEKKWELKHKVIYEEKHGKIPKQHAVIFLDKNKLNLDIKNLELVTRRVLLLLNRNNWIKEDPLITKYYIKIAQLQEKIYTKKKRKKND